MNTYKQLSMRAILVIALAMLMNSAMAADYETHKIETYNYAQFSSTGKSSIDLYDYDNNQVGILIFLPVEAAALPHAYQDSQGLSRLYYPSSSLASVVDLLRNESPIVLRFWNGSGNNSHIGTAKRELVGEGE